jgi:hypothetical protein
VYGLLAPVAEEERGERENESAIFLSCASILVALESEEVKRDVVSACHRGGINLIQLLLDVDIAFPPNMPKTSSQILQCTRMQLLLSMGTKVHGPAYKETCEGVYDKLDKQMERHVKQSFYDDNENTSSSSSGKNDALYASELLSRCWARIPQLKENQLGTSRTRGITGVQAWSERMDRLCSGMENQLKTFQQLGQVDALPFQEVQHVVFKCNTICKYMCELLQCNYTFRPTVSIDKIVGAMESYFSLCQKLCRVSRGNNYKHGGSLSHTAVAQALMAIMELQRVLRQTVSGSLLIWVHVFVKHLNMIAKLSLTKALLQSEIGHTLMDQVMTTLLDFVESFKVSFVLKLKPHVIALPCLVLIHICKQRDGEEGKWLSIAGTSFRYLSSIIRCTSLQWPTQQMQVLIATCLLETTQILVEKLTLLANKGNTKYVKQREDLCVMSCEALSLMNQTSSVTYAAFREKSIAIYRDVSDQLAHLPRLKSRCDDILHGLQSSLRPLCVAKWSIVDESDLPSLTLEGLPDVLQTMFKESKTFEIPAQANEGKTNNAVGPAGKAKVSEAMETDDASEGLKRAREEDQPEITKEKKMSSAAANGLGMKIEEIPAKKTKQKESKPTPVESASVAMSSGSGPKPMQQQQPTPLFDQRTLFDLPQQPKGLAANYEDLSSDSEGEALSLDSGLGED